MERILNAFRFFTINSNKNAESKIVNQKSIIILAVNKSANDIKSTV